MMKTTNNKGTKNMISSGTITLPNDQTVSAGQGGSYHIGSDTYPVTIVGWSKSGKTVFYQAAVARPTKDSDFYGTQSHLFVADPSAPVKKATWRKGDESFRPKGSKHGSIGTSGYRSYLDPGF